MDWLGSAIGAAGDLIGGFLGRDSAKDAAAQNIAMQKKFAQEGITWRVQDAKKAGVHPLYALGSQTTAFSPVAINDPLPAAISEASSSVGRAVNATASAPERQLNLEIMKEQLRGARLKNDAVAADMVASQNKLFTQAGTGKPIPTWPVPTDSNIDANPRMIIGGAEFKADPNFSPAETLEKRYNDIATVYGAYLAAKDAEFNTGKSLGRIAYDWLDDGARKMNKDFEWARNYIYDYVSNGIRRRFTTDWRR